MKFIIGLALAGFIATALPVSARDFVIQVEKVQKYIDIRSMSVTGGTVTGLPGGKEPDKFTVTISLPEGVCYAKLRVNFPGFEHSELSSNLCGGGTLRIGTPKSKPGPTAADMPADLQCDTVLAKENSSPAAMSMAAGIYFRGIWMGEKCGKVDYKKSFALLRKAGDAKGFAAQLKTLKDRAAGGNPKAASALKTIDLSPVTH